MNMKNFVFIALLALMFASCEKEYVEKRITVDLPAFEQVELYQTFEVYLIEDSTFFVEVVGDENFVDHAIFDVVDGILKIDNDKSLKWASPGNNVVKLYIHSNPLRSLSAKVACNIQTITPITSWEFQLILGGKVNQADLELACNTFWYWNEFPCGGHVRLRGTADIAAIWNFALMTVDAKDLIARNAKVENSSKGRCEVQVTNKFEYSITGVGDIHLHSQPNEILVGEVSSSGQLIQH